MRLIPPKNTPNKQTIIILFFELYYSILFIRCPLFLAVVLFWQQRPSTQSWHSDNPCRQWHPSSLSLLVFILSVYTVIRFLWVISKSGTCTVGVSVYGTLVEDKMRRFKGECAHFSFSKCHIYTRDGASANFSTNSNETDNSVAGICSLYSPAERWGVEPNHTTAKMQGFLPSYSCTTRFVR
jgi:hypothetical protein